MFLRRLTLENIRSIEHLDLDLTTPAGEPRRWTYILGPNGAGKSTILRSIALVLAGSNALLELLGDAGDWIRQGRQGGRIALEYQTADGELRTAELTLIAGDTTSTVYERNLAFLRTLDDAIAKAERNYFTVGYGVSRRPADDVVMAAKSGVFRNSRAQAVGTLFSPHATLASLETWAIERDYARQGSFSEIAESVNRLLHDVRFERIDRVSRQLIFRTPDGLIPFRRLGDAYQNVAAWTGDLLRHITDTFADRRDPFLARGLLLVDEVDLHLHAVWQRQLINYVGDRFPNLQFVLTTHSPLTAHQAAEGELYQLERQAETAPAELSAYVGAPRTLLLHQFLTSGVFGLDTLDSVAVEAIKNEYRELRDDPAHDDEARSRLIELRSYLADVPDWTGETPGTSRLRVLADQLEARSRIAEPEAVYGTEEPAG
jgi:predicted ATPase